MSRKTLILGIVLIALIALAYVYQGPLRNWQNNLGKPKNFLAGINSGKIDKIEITLRGTAVVLIKQGEKWKIGGTKDFYAGPGLIANVLASLNQAAVSEFELVSNNRERKNQFQTGDSGLKVKIFQAGKPAADFIVGASSGFASAYISTPSLASTYLVKAPLEQAFNQSEWRDLTIFSSDKTKINKIRFQYPSREFSLEFLSGKWSGVLPKKFTVNQAQIGKIVDLMANQKATRIPGQSFKGAGLEKHLIIIEASGDGVDNILMIGDGLGDLYYAKRGDSDNIYLIDKTVRDELDKARLLYK